MKLNKEMATMKDKLLGHCACHGSHTLATVDDQLKNNLEFIYLKPAVWPQYTTWILNHKV